jgi:short-subunit dehydrogenase
MKKVLILGATSGIAEAFAHSVLKRFPGAYLCLVARNAPKLESIRADLRVRYGLEPQVIVADLNELSGMPALMKKLADTSGPESFFDGILMAHGSMEDETVAQENFSKALPVLVTNYVGPVCLCSSLVPHLGEGTRLAVITSVAGDRGRPSNFIYGSAKAGLQAYLSGLRAKLFKKKVHVLDVRPGFVATAMTAHLNRSGPLWATPERVSEQILEAMLRKKDVIYAPGFWRLIMFVIRSIPGFVFKRTKL